MRRIERTGQEVDAGRGWRGADQMRMVMGGMMSGEQVAATAAVARRHNVAHAAAVTAAATTATAW